MIEHILLVLAGFIKAVISSLGYPGIAVLMGIESACIPLPSEVIMPFAGYLEYTRQFSSLAMVATLGAIGCNLGSILAYEVGAYGGRPLIEKYGRYILLNKHDLEVADRLFQKWGSAMVFIGRLLPIIRTFIALPAGIARMPRLRFHIYTFLGSWPWCFGLAYVGMVLQNNWMSIKPYFLRFKEVILVFLIAGTVWFFWTHWKNRI